MTFFDRYVILCVSTYLENYMKHIFVINPSAGSGAGVATLKEKISALKCDCEIYETTAHRDAVRFVKEYCEKTDAPVRFYACGGDGTLKEVAEGVIGYPHASFTVCPIGSGNDFVKYFGGAEGFLDLERLTEAEDKKVDAIGISADGIEDTYSINVCNFGFEAYVAGTMHKVRRKPIIGGSNAYTTGIVAAIFKAMKTRGEIYADGKLINPKGAFILCTAANGGYVGGGYYCAPRAAVDDGMLDICMIKPVSLITLVRLIGTYKKGGHLDDKRFAKYITYCRAKKVEVITKKPFFAALDGEVFETTHLVAEIKEGVLNFAAPSEKVKVNV